MIPLYLKLRDLSRQPNRLAMRWQGSPIGIPVIDRDAGVAGWNCQNDHENPTSIMVKQKKMLVLFVSSITFVPSLATSMLSRTLARLPNDFRMPE
jgi:hypothetical protein